MQTMPAPVMGTQEVASILGISPASVHVMRSRGAFAEPDWIISGAPVWKPQTIKAWAKATGRLSADGSHYVVLTGGRPKRQAVI